MCDRFRGKKRFEISLSVSLVKNYAIFVRFFDHVEKLLTDVWNSFFDLFTNSKIMGLIWGNKSKHFIARNIFQPISLNRLDDDDGF